jgi:hypothetical protein
VNFKSDQLRQIVKAAVKQKVMVLDTDGRHPALVCVTCDHREVVTASGKMHEHEIKKKICRLRLHGLTWAGRGGTHA